MIACLRSAHFQRVEAGEALLQRRLSEIAQGLGDELAVLVEIFDALGDDACADAIHIDLMVRLPATALMPVNRGVQVAVLGDSNKVVLKSIQLGRDFGDTVEVTAGLAPQDRVIDSPPETLQTGDTVQIAAPTPSSTATQAGAPASPATQ